MREGTEIGRGVLMDDAVMNARHYETRAINMEALAAQEGCPERRRLMLSIAEQYYVLHDKFLDLSKSSSAQVIPFKR